MSHNHVPRVASWKFDAGFNLIPDLYGCVGCTDTFTVLPTSPESSHVHIGYVEGCFACKLPTLQLCTGDANSAAAMAGRKWDRENQAFVDAVKQGVEPSGVSMHDIEASLKASEILGVPYDAGTMMEPEKITPRAAEIMRAIGDI